MLLHLLLLQLSIIVGTSSHKLPYSYLLDIGNEGQENVNTERIRISKTGGSLALRYPAVGQGDDITHVTVTGVDLGDDLTADVVDGGPGYKYVIIVLTGGGKEEYDAIVTVQTLGTNEVGTNLVPGTNEALVQETDSANVSEEEETRPVEYVADNEIAQETVNTYNYVSDKNEKYSNSEHNDDENDEENNEDITANQETPVDNDEVDSANQEAPADNEEESANQDVATIDEQEADQSEDSADDDDPIYIRQKPNNYNKDTENAQALDQDLYEKYQAIRQYLFNNQRYIQRNNMEESRPFYEKDSVGNAIDYQRDSNGNYVYYDPRAYVNTNNFERDNSAVDY